MSFDLAKISAAMASHGPLVRVVVARVDGSTPREAGAAMLVWAGQGQSGQSGTIGGGALEFQATKTARRMLTDGPMSQLKVEPLGPALGQCCGGAVTLVYERITEETLPKLYHQTHNHPYYLRRISSDAADQPPKNLLQNVQRHTASQTAQSTAFSGGWLTEPFHPQSQTVWIYGAGHVGRTLAQTLAPLPDFEVSLIDIATDRFPDPMPNNTTALLAPNPADLVAHAPKAAHHLVMTHSHALDLEICHQLLLHRFSSAGLIGSASKWGRFRKRLAQLGHGAAQISSITCPIGDPSLGKHPQAVAIGVAAVLLRQDKIAESAKDVA